MEIVYVRDRYVYFRSGTDLKRNRRTARKKTIKIYENTIPVLGMNIVSNKKLRNTSANPIPLFIVQLLKLVRFITKIIISVYGKDVKDRIDRGDLFLIFAKQKKR